MPDFSAQFRRQPHRDESALAEYVAFKVFDRRQVSLLIRQANGESDWVKYTGFLRSKASKPFGSPLLVLFTSLAVRIEGDNLHEIAEGIAKERCGFIEQFDPARHRKPADPSTAVIRHLTTYAPELPQEPEREKVYG